MSKYYKFDSGLVLLYENNKINKATSIEIGFDCGARCDGDLAGLSHFCEHMFFTGTDKLNKQEVTKRYYDFINVNAYTTNSDIVFTGNIATSKLGEYLTTVQDMICSTTFKPKAIVEEKKVVLQEIVQASDNHVRIAEELFYYDIYGLEYYKNGVLGNKQSVSKITSKHVKSYVKKYFVKNNCVISICSPLTFNKVKSLIRTHFDSTMPSNQLKALPYMDNKLVAEQKVENYNKKIDKNFLSVVFKFDKNGPDLKYRTILGILCSIVDDISDGLTQELRIKNGLTYAMGSDYMINHKNSYLELRTEISSENIKPCIDIIIDYMRNLKNNGITTELLKREKEKDEYYWQTRIPKPNDVRYCLTRYRFYDKFVSNKDIHNSIQSVNLDEFNKVVTEILNTSKIQVFVYGNASKKDIFTIKQIIQKFN